MPGCVAIEALHICERLRVDVQGNQPAVIRLHVLVGPSHRLPKPLGHDWGYQLEKV